MKAISLGLLLFAAPAAAKEARLAIVIDDFGYDPKGTPPDAEWYALPWAFTAAIMPESPRSAKSAAEAVASKKEHILHFPFDPFLTLKLSSGAVDSADQAVVSKLLDKSLLQVAGVRGLNNHRSYRATMNQPLMEWFAGRLKEKGLFFVDSRVSGKTIAFAEARRVGVPAAINDFFLDTGPKSGEAFCRRWLDAGAAVARKRGSAIVIGHHYFRSTLECLKKRVPELQASGIEFVPLSQLVH
ncbi:MAG: divergent polysaccharide deacetylase family protein [Elusimicrobia bacterium]|nr:divergent polysaccharide deacetylase family protein [Elusimicrobiota bacterium]